MDVILPHFIKPRAILEALPVALIIVDNNGRIVSVNKQIEKLFGYQRTELEDKFIKDLIPPSLRHTDAYWASYISNSKDNRINSDLESLGLKKDGTEFPIKISVSPLDIEEASLALVIAEDMTSRKKIEDANNFLSAIVEYSDESIIGNDLRGNILSWNHGAEQLYGYSAEESIGKNITFIFPPELKVEFDNILKKIKNGGHIKISDTLNINKDNKLIPTSLTISPIKNSAGKVIGISTMGRNITLQKYLENELQFRNQTLEQQNRVVLEATQSKSEFLANMSHELRTPLSVIIGFAKLMHNGLAGPISSIHKEYLEDILSNSNHLLQLINDILDLSKIEAGKLEFNYEVTDIHKFMTETQANLIMMADKKNIHLEITIAPNLTHCTIDRIRLKQIIYNYFSNALKFTSEGGQITIRLLDEDKENFRLEVEDTGKGIRKEDLNRLFVEFQQLDSSFSKEGQGTGLGLALTRHIVEKQGGKVGVNSVFGKGSTFIAILPICPPKEQIDRDTKKTEAQDSIYENPKILIVESKSQIRSEFLNSLEDMGYEVNVAENLSEAIKGGYQHQFDAIVIDLFLPDMKDWTILRKLRAENIGEKLAPLVTTVLTEKKLDFCFKIHDFLIKPVIEDELNSALKWVGSTPENTKLILIIDNDQEAIDRISTMLNKMNYHFICETNAKNGLNIVKKEHPDVIVLDPILLGKEGFDFLYALRKSDVGSYTPVVILSRKNLNNEEYDQLRSFSQRIVLQGTGPKTNLFKELKSFLPVSRKMTEKKETDKT